MPTNISILEGKLLNQGMDITAQQVGNPATQLWCGKHLAPASTFCTTIQCSARSLHCKLSYCVILITTYVTLIITFRLFTIFSRAKFAGPLLTSTVWQFVCFSFSVTQLRTPYANYVRMKTFK